MKLVKSFLVVGLLLGSQVNFASEPEDQIVDRTTSCCTCNAIMYMGGLGIMGAGAVITGQGLRLIRENPDEDDYRGQIAPVGAVLMGLGGVLTGYFLAKLERSNERRRVVLNNQPLDNIIPLASAYRVLPQNDIESQRGDENL